MNALICHPDPVSAYGANPAEIRRKTWTRFSTGRQKLEFHLDRLALGIGQIAAEEIHRREAEHARDDVRRERLDLRIQVAHHAVIKPPRGLDLIFGVRELALQT